MIRKESYLSVGIPKNKDPKLYNVYQRRANILKLIIDAGHIRAFSQSFLAELHGVGQPQICADIKALKPDLLTLHGEDLESDTELAVRKATKSLLQSKSEKDQERAARLLMDYHSHLQTTGIKKKVADQIEVKNSGGQIITHEDFSRAFAKREKILIEEEEKAKTIKNSQNGGQ